MVTTFINPLYKRKENDISPLSQADPYIIEENGVYYVYATGNEGVVLYKSNNFTDWEYAGIVYTEPSRKEYWAPSVIKIDGMFYMYVSNMPFRSDDAHEQAIRVAVSETPEGPFEFKNTILPPFSIDAHVVNYKENLYMFYCVNDYDSERAGTYIVLDKMLSPFSMEGRPKAAVKPTLDEEIFERNRFKAGQHWHTIEGAFYFYESGSHYLLYSGSAYTKETYFIGYSTAKGGVDDLRELDFQKQPSDSVYSPLLARSKDVEGTGHNSVLKHNGNFYIIYHGRNTNETEKTADIRTFRADKLEVKNGKLLCTPTVGKTVKFI